MLRIQGPVRPRPEDRATDGRREERDTRAEVYGSFQRDQSKEHFSAAAALW
jgi:hypothetical protein